MKRLLIGGVVLFTCGVAAAGNPVPVPRHGPAGAPRVPAHPAVAQANHCEAISQPLPSVVATTLPTVGAVPTPGSYQLANCATGTCRQPVAPQRDGSCLRKIGAWLTYQPCPATGPCFVFEPYRAPLRAYFPCRSAGETAPGCPNGECGGSGPNGCGALSGRGGCGPVQRTRNLIGGMGVNQVGDTCTSATCSTAAPTCSVVPTVPPPPPSYLRGACPPTKLGLLDRIRGWFGSSDDMPCSVGCPTPCPTCGGGSPVSFGMPGTVPLTYGPRNVQQPFSNP